MDTEEAAKTVILVCAARPEPGMEREMEARGISLLWAHTIKAATALLGAAPEGEVQSGPKRLSVTGVAGKVIAPAPTA